MNLARRVALLLAVAGMALLLASGIALAAVLVGTEGPDQIEGTEEADVITALGGDDFVVGLGGNDEIDAGAGVDIAPGFGGDDTIVGGADSDALTGSRGNDIVLGGEGDDVVIGQPGVDQVDGEAGNDVLLDGKIIILDERAGNKGVFALPAQLSDLYERLTDGAVKGNGRGSPANGDQAKDNFSGGEGDDLIFVRSKKASKDIVACGPGNDVVKADRKDEVAEDCEEVKRSR